MSEIVVSLPSAELREAMGSVPGVRFVAWDMKGPAPEARFDIVVPPYLQGIEPLRWLEGVQTRLVQWQMIGFEGVQRYLTDETPFANATSVHEASTAELALALVLAVQRGLPGFVRSGEAGQWISESHTSLADRRVLLIGYGGVAKAIEERLAPFEVQLRRLARRAREDRNLSGEAVRVHGMDVLHAQLAKAEIVVLAVPLTADTQGLLNAETLAVLPDGALVVNVARGPVVDTEALAAEVQTGRLRAALDVTDPEPLPQDHPLWGRPNVLISPHVGGASSAMLPRMAGLIRRQIEHLRAGEQPENLIVRP